MGADDEENGSGISGEFKDDKEAKIPGVAQREYRIRKRTEYA